MSQQQSFGDVQVQGDDNIFNAIQAEVVTLTQTKIIQISVDEIKTRQLIHTSPYKGLKKFEPEDSDRFFGRDQFLAGLVNELEQTNFVLLLGASGSGKSSVVRAGLIFWLQQKSGKHFMSLMVTPDKDPFESLYGSLLSRGFSQSQAQMAKAGKVETLSQTVKTLKPPESYWLIFVDQFEELFTVSEADKRDRFIQSLVKLSKEHAKDPSLKIVATMRSDFLNHLDPAPANLLARLTDKHRPLITQMHPDELRLAIEQPAAHHGVVFETGLVEEIIKEVQGQAGYLPLLQYTLDELWETEVKEGGIEDRTLNTSSYRQIGGVRGALQQRVEQMYQSLSPAEQLAAQRIFLKLVEIGDAEATGAEWKPVQRRASRTEFTDQTEQAVLTHLITANLLVSDAPVAELAEKRLSAEGAGGATVEIAHEILLTSWSRLRDWIQSNRQSIALRNRLNHDVMLWQAKRADSDLWSGSKLVQVVELRHDSVFKRVLGGYSDLANQFIDASLGLRDRQLKAQKRRVRVLSGLLIGALIAVGFALYQLQRAQRQRVEQLAATAEALLATQPVEAEVNAIAAFSLSQSAFVQFPDRPQFANAEDSLLNAQRNNSERQRFRQEAVIYSIAFSPDGKNIVSGSSDNTVRLWDAQTGALKRKLTGHEAQVYFVAFSPDGKTIASGSKDKTVRLWDAQTGALKHRLTGHEAMVNSVAFSPDGKTIVSGSRDKTVRLWDAQTGALKHKLTGHQDVINSVAFSPDGKTVVSGSEDKTVRLWDAQTGVLKHKLTGHEDVVSFVTFSPNGQTIASGSKDKTVRLWDAQTGALKSRLTGHEAMVNSVAFSPDSKTIASSSGDKTVRLWDAQTEVQLTGHGDVVSSTTFSPDGKTIASSSWDKTVRLWDAQTGALKRKLIGHQDQVMSVAFSPDSKTIASGSGDETVRLWDARTGILRHKLTGEGQIIMSVAFSPDGKTIASGSWDGTVRLWNAQTGALQHKLTGQKGIIFSVAFSPDSKTVVTGSGDKTLRLWDAQTGSLKGKPLIGFMDQVMSVAFSPDGKTIVSSSRDGTVRLWDAQTETPKGKPLTGSMNQVMSVVFSPDGKTIVSGSSDGTVRLWDAQTGTLEGSPLIGHEAPVMSVAFSPDGRTIVSGSGDKTLRLWDASLASLQIACQQLQYHSILTDPTTVAKEAQVSCQKAVWSKQTSKAPVEPQ